MVKKTSAKPPKDDLTDPVAFSIGDRTFVMEDNPSPEQDFYIMEKIERMGLFDIQPEQIAGKRMDRETKRVLMEAYRSGQLFNLLGAVMVEKGVEWSEENGEENAELFRTTRDPEARKFILRNATFVLMSFFASGLTSSVTSPSFLGGLAGATSAISPRGESSNSETGSPQSEKSRKATLIAQKRLQNGRSGKS